MLAEGMSIKSTEREYVRSAWLIEGPKTDHSLCVLLDGQHYRDNVHALPIFSTLMERGSIPPMTLVFVSHGGPRPGTRTTSVTRSSPGSSPRMS